ncbi:MAG: hypothetical protein RL685_3557 [Pseudomonadota bacterium]|jgi:hypothetical protein
MSHFPPFPRSSTALHCSAPRAPRVTLLRWGTSLSLSLVLLACGGVADLQLGQDSNALEGTANDAPGAANADPPAAIQVPQPGTEPPAVTPVPGQVYLVDPATGQLYLPCTAALPAGVATDEPNPAVAPASDDPPAQVPVAADGTGSATAVPGVPADGSSATGVGVAGTPGISPCDPVSAPSGSGHSAAGGQPAPTSDPSVPNPLPTTEPPGPYPVPEVAPASPSPTEVVAPQAGTEPASTDPVAND